MSERRNQWTKDFISRVDRGRNRYQDKMERTRRQQELDRSYDEIYPHGIEAGRERSSNWMATGAEDVGKYREQETQQSEQLNSEMNKYRSDKLKQANDIIDNITRYDIGYVIGKNDSIAVKGSHISKAGLVIRNSKKEGSDFVDIITKIFANYLTFKEFSYVFEIILQQIHKGNWNDIMITKNFHPFTPDSKESIYLNMMFSRMNHYSENDKKDFMKVYMISLNKGNKIWPQTSEEEEGLVGGQSGGFFKKLGNRMNVHNNPHRAGLPTDCCPCVFSFLGMPPEIFIPLQDQFGTGQGMTPEQLVATLYTISNTPGYNYNWEMKKADIPGGAAVDQHRGGEALSTALTQLFSLIPNGFGTLGGFYRLDGTGHCIALGKTDDGTPIIYDVQQGKWFTNESPGWRLLDGAGQHVTKYFVDNNIVSLYYLHGTIDGSIVYEDESGARIDPHAAAQQQPPAAQHPQQQILLQQMQQAQQQTAERLNITVEQLLELQQQAHGMRFAGGGGAGRSAKRNTRRRSAKRNTRRRSAKKNTRRRSAKRNTRRRSAKRNTRRSSRRK